MTGVPGTARGWCANHYGRWQHHGDPLGGGPSRKRVWEPICRLCGEHKSEADFPVRKESGKRRTECKACLTDISTAWARAHKIRRKEIVRRYSGRPESRERAAENALMRAHGIDRETARHLRSRTACDICHRPVSRRHIDHDHKTKRIRGVLCPDCNWGLGHFGDDPARLMAAARYLTTAE